MLKQLSCFEFFLCYLLNISSFCIGSTSWCCFVVPLFRGSSLVPLFCEASVPLFRQCSASVPPVLRVRVFLVLKYAPIFTMILREAMLEWLQPSVGLKTCEREPIAPYCKIISKAACCYSFRVFLLVVGRFESFKVVPCCRSFQVVSFSL